jgi:hypothetical protein
MLDVWGGVFVKDFSTKKFEKLLVLLPVFLIIKTKTNN